MKLFSCVEKCAEFKKQTLEKSAGTQKSYAQLNTPGFTISQNSAKMGVSLWVYHLNHEILVVKCKFWQQTIYRIMMNVQYKKETDMARQHSNTRI